MKIRFNKSRIKLIAIITAVLLFAGLSTAAIYYYTNVAALPIKDPTEFYDNAYERSAEGQYTYTVRFKETISVGEETYNRSHTQVITVEDGMRYQVYNTLQIGSVSINYTEYYNNGIAYLYLNGGQFYWETSVEEFTSPIVPLYPVTAENYKQINGTTKRGTTNIHFTESSPEVWLAGHYTNYKSGSATVTIDRNGTITETQYTAEYAKDERYISCTVSTMPNDHFPFIVETPESTNGYVKITGTNDILVLEEAANYLLATKSLDSTYSDTILCEAFGDIRKQNITITTDSSNSWTSEKETQITLSNSSTEGSATTLIKTESYRDGVLTTKTDSNDTTTDPAADIDTVKSSCQDIFVGTILLPQHIKAVDIKQEGAQTTYYYICNEDFAQLLSEEACNTLYRDGQILSLAAQNHETLQIEGQLTVNNATGLPVDSAFQYKGIYTINGIDYTLEFSATQQYQPIG